MYEINFKEFRYHGTLGGIKATNTGGIVWITLVHVYLLIVSNLSAAYVGTLQGTGQLIYRLAQLGVHSM